MELDWYVNTNQGCGAVPAQRLRFPIDVFINGYCQVILTTNVLSNCWYNYILQCQITKTPLFGFVSECNFINGQAYGGTEKFVGEKATSQECFLFVKEYYPTARGAVWQAVDTNRGGEGNCMVLISNTGVDDNPTYQTCLFEGEIKIFSKIKELFQKPNPLLKWFYFSLSFIFRQLCK